MKNKIIYITIIVIALIIIPICIIYANKQKEVNKKYEEQTTYEGQTVDEKNITVTENENIAITQSGTYKITGKSTNSNITINTEDEVTLILDSLELTNKEGPAILIENSKHTTILLKNNNKLSNGENEEFDAVIYSKDDLTINGDGTLEIIANYENGIKCKDDLIINSNITINSNTNGIIGKDSVTIKSGNINITSGGDAIKANNDEEESKGNITIENANITINSQEDGIQAEQTLTINNGTFNIKTPSGAKTLNGKTERDNTQTTSEESKKAIKASNIIINKGNFIIDSFEDGIHSNGNLTINNGTIEIKSSDDALHGDALIEINDGTLNLTASEGIEGTYVKINGGNITINAADDGINAGKKSNEYTPTIEINGGNITIQMSSGDTDAIDSNGNLYINGGTLNITGNSPFDYDGEAKYTGGKLIVNGKETTEITNQFMGGMQGGMQDRNMNGEPNQGIRR